MPKYYTMHNMHNTSSIMHNTS